MTLKSYIESYELLKTDFYMKTKHKNYQREKEEFLERLFNIKN